MSHSGVKAYKFTLIILFVALMYFQKMEFKNKALEIERFCWGEALGMDYNHKREPVCSAEDNFVR